jgi:hypothetical protein
MTAVLSSSSISSSVRVPIASDTAGDENETVSG